MFQIFNENSSEFVFFLKIYSIVSHIKLLGNNRNKTYNKALLNTTKSHLIISKESQRLTLINYMKFPKKLNHFVVKIQPPVQLYPEFQKRLYLTRDFTHWNM
jgi:hypothetical protein